MPISPDKLPKISTTLNQKFTRRQLLAYVSTGLGVAGLAAMGRGSKVEAQVGRTIPPIPTPEANPEHQPFYRSSLDLSLMDVNGNPAPGVRLIVADYGGEHETNGVPYIDGGWVNGVKYFEQPDSNGFFSRQEEFPQALNLGDLQNIEIYGTALVFGKGASNYYQDVAQNPDLQPFVASLPPEQPLQKATIVVNDISGEGGVNIDARLIQDEEGEFTAIVSSRYGKHRASYDEDTNLAEHFGLAKPVDTENTLEELGAQAKVTEITIDTDASGELGGPTITFTTGDETITVSPSPEAQVAGMVAQNAIPEDLFLSVVNPTVQQTEEAFEQLINSQQSQGGEVASMASQGKRLDVVGVNVSTQKKFLVTVDSNSGEKAQALVSGLTRDTRVSLGWQNGEVVVVEVNGPHAPVVEQVRQTPVVTPTPGTNQEKNRLFAPIIQ